MKKIYAILMVFVFLIIGQAAFASKIPDAELNFIKKEIGNVNVRFDGMLQFPDGTSYIPVYPLKSEFPENNVALSITIPAKKSIKDKPDFFMFNTNFAFFKIKNDNGKSTIIYNEQIPAVVKMGLLPQDLLVPVGFQLPAELRIIIGDLIIPFTPSKEYKEVIISKETTKDLPTVNIVSSAAEQLSGRYFYTTSFNKNALTVLNADTGKPFKQIDFSSIPSDVKLSNDGKYILLTTWKNPELYVVDANKAEVLKAINVGQKPSYIAVSKIDNVAYVANRDENTISVIDLVTMKALDNIIVKGNPTYLELSENGEKLYYLDATSGIVYYVQKNDDVFNPYVSKPLFRTNNISKIQLVADKIYTFDRGNNELEIFYTEGKPQTKGLVSVSDITTIDDVQKETSLTNDKVSDNELNSVEIVDKKKKRKKEKMPEVLKEEKVPFKENIRNAFRRVLYYKDDNTETEEYFNPANEIAILDVKEEIKPQDKGVEVTVKKSLKNYFHEFMNYKPIEDPVPFQKRLKLNIDKQMDFVKLQKRANDFLVINDKIYVLCSDDYIVYVYDAKTKELINSFELEKIGYYNALKASADKKIGIVTNISSMSLTLFDTANDVVVQKLPLMTNVHNVVITGKN